QDARGPRATLPDLHTFGIQGSLLSLFKSVGFRDVHEETSFVPCPWPGDAEHFWHALPEHAWRFEEMLKNVLPEYRKKAAAQAICALKRYESNGTLHLTVPIVIATGKR